MGNLKLFLDNIFPLPSYLRMPALGIDISDRSVKYVELKNGKGGLKLKDYGHKGIEAGIVENGQIKDKTRLVKILKTLRRPSCSHFVAASLPEEKAFFKVVVLPNVKEEEIRNTLRLQIEEVVPLPLANIVFDFDVMSRKAEGIEVLLTAFPKAVAESYVEIFEMAGFFPISFEVESQSLFRSLLEEEEKEAVMIIDFGKTGTSFVVGEDGFVKFSSTIKVGGEHLDRSLSKNLNIDIFEAEEIKKKDLLLELGRDKFLASVLPVISVIKEEAARVLDYWRSHGEDHRSNEVAKIILCGGDSSMTGLVEYFAYSLKIKTVLGNPWVNINSFEKYVPEMDRNTSLRYATALGLALWSFKKTSFI